MSHLKVPLFGVLNFAGVFLILYFTNVVTFSTLIIGILAGLVIGIFTELIFHKRNPNKRRKKRLPSTVSTKFILIPSVLLILLITFSFLFITGNNPFETEGHTTKEEVDTSNEEIIIEEITEEVIEEEEIEENPDEICTFADGINCIEYKVEGQQKRVSLKIENTFGSSLKKVRAYINEPGVDKFLCKLYCIYGCIGPNDDEIPSGGIATFLGEQYCRIPESGELIADTKLVYENGVGTEFKKIGTLKTKII